MLLELEEMQHCRTPKDKLDLLVKACSRLPMSTEATSSVTAASSSNADDLLPQLIVGILQAQPTKLMDDLAYIQRYRDPQQLKSAQGYLFTNCLAACQFIRSLDVDELAFPGLEADGDGEKEREERRRKVEEVLNESAKPTTANAYTRSPSLDMAKLEERASRVLGTIKQSRPVQGLKRFLGEAESAIREGIDAVMSSSDDESELQGDDEKKKKEEAAEEEFQLQLAMALSLSEQDLLKGPVAATMANSIVRPVLIETWYGTRDTL